MKINIYIYKFKNLFMTTFLYKFIKKYKLFIKMSIYSKVGTYSKIDNN